MNTYQRVSIPNANQIQALGLFHVVCVCVCVGGFCHVGAQKVWDHRTGVLESSSLQQKGDGETQTKHSVVNTL